MDKQVAKGTALASATDSGQACGVPLELAYTDWYRAACRLRRTSCKAVGVLAVGGAVNAAEVALCLAPALLETAAAPVAVLMTVEDHDELALGNAIEANVNVVEAPGWPPDIEALAQAVVSLRARHAHVLVPLAGVELHGDPLPLTTFLDGVVLVARAGKVTERELVSLREKIDRAKQLGVLLLQA